MIPRPIIRRCFLVTAVAALSGSCSESATFSDPGDSRTRLHRVANGEPVDSESAVFLVESSHGLCSASLITPDLLLSAAHCLTGQFQDVRCAETPLGQALPAEDFRVTRAPNLQVAPVGPIFSDVADVHVLSPHADVCGHDVGLLRLKEPVSGLAPLPVAAPTLVAVGNQYRVVGYGAGHTGGTGERVRRTSAWTQIVCTGEEDCDTALLSASAGAPSLSTPHLEAGEWLGKDGACPGDSGGPALVTTTGPNQQTREAILGVVSRGTEDCALSIYSVANTSPLRSFVRARAIEAGYPVPEWAVLEKEPAAAAGAPGSEGGASTDTDTGGSGAASSGGLPSVRDDGKAQANAGCACRWDAGGDGAESALPARRTKLFAVIIVGLWYARRSRRPGPLPVRARGSA